MEATASGPLALQIRLLTATADFKLTSMDKWRQRIWVGTCAWKFSGVLWRLVVMGRIPCNYNGFGKFQARATEPEREDF